MQFLSSLFGNGNSKHSHNSSNFNPNNTKTAVQPITGYTTGGDARCGMSAVSLEQSENVDLCVLWPSKTVTQIKVSLMTFHSMACDGSIMQYLFIHSILLFAGRTARSAMGILS